jgi:inner membrane protein YidH
MQDYYQDSAREMILRDQLATDRTHLANERTLLAYYRTALTLFIAGATFVKFFGSLLMVFIGWVFIPLGVLVAVVGLVNYNRLKLPLDRLKERAVTTDNSES